MADQDTIDPAIAAAEKARAAALRSLEQLRADADARAAGSDVKEDVTLVKLPETPNRALIYTQRGDEPPAPVQDANGVEHLLAERPQVVEVCPSKTAAAGDASMGGLFPVAHASEAACPKTPIPGRKPTAPQVQGK